MTGHDAPQASLDPDGRPVREVLLEVAGYVPASSDAARLERAGGESAT